jgi:succinate dehydrogenase/fumarate reductase flavoprotein subunit
MKDTQTSIIETDVIVVGGGGGGLAAAIEAATAGASVILLEKNPALGGSTAWSVGSISATRTPHQKKKGIEDSPDEHFEDMEVLAGSYSNRDNRELRRLLVDRTTETIAWLESMGIVFAGPNVEPPHRKPRMHNVLPNSKSFPYHLGRHARRLGVDIRLATRAVRLIEENGRVALVECKDAHGQQIMLRARGGIILAAGDYSGSREMKGKYAGPEVVDLEPVNATATGDGFGLGLEHGAEMVNGDIVRGPIMRFIPPRKASLIGRMPPWRPVAQVMKLSMDRLPEQILRPFAMKFLTTALGPSPDLFRHGAILVNAEGRRFAEETQKPALKVPHQPDRLAYIVMDADIAARFEAWPYFISTAPGIAYAYLADYRRNRPDIYKVGSTPQELAKAMGIDPRGLAAELQQYNDVDRLARPGDFPALSSGPFVALGPVRSYVVFTDGGLRVTSDLEVLGPSGQPIPGLYAAGSNGQGGVLLEGHGHHLVWAFISGRIAGANAAKAAGRSGIKAKTNLEAKATP